MAEIRLFDVHRTWEDWLGIGIGFLIGLTPWIAGQADSPAILYNTAFVGALVVALAALEMVDLQRWEEGGEIALGLWLIASPFVFGYADSGALRHWHFVLGSVVILLAVYELWQDWSLDDRQLAEHGR